MNANEIQDQFKMTDGFNLFYRCWEAGAEAERIVVGIHSGGGHSGDFRVVGPQLASDGNQVYALDLRGFGNSLEKGLPRGDTSNFERHLQDMDDTIGCVKRKHPNKKVYVLGYSMGGCYALWHAAHYPNSLDGLVLVAPAITVRVLSTRKTAVQLFLANLFAPRGMLDSRKSSYSEGKDPEVLKLQLQDKLLAWELSHRYLANMRRILMDRAFENASHIQKPTLILQGEADVTALPEGAKRLYESLKAEDKSIQTFPEADHKFYDLFSSIPLRAKHDPAKIAHLFSVLRVWLKTS